MRAIWRDGELVTEAEVGPFDDPAHEPEHDPATCAFCAAGTCWTRFIPLSTTTVGGDAA